MNIRTPQLPRLHKPSPSLAVSVVALVVAMGGTSYAAMTIGSRDVENDSLRGIDVRDGSLRGIDVRDGSLRAKDFRGGLPAGETGPVGPEGPQGEQGPAGAGRWVLVNADGEIEAQSGGFTLVAGYPTLANTSPDGTPSNALRANGNVYINAGEDLTDNAVVATIALQNTADQNGDAVTSGRAPGPDANPEFSGEIAASQCIAGLVNCAPPGAGNPNTFVVSPRMSDGSFTTDDNRKRFYVIITGDSTDFVAP
jgi:hypothetical protein